MLIRKKNIPSKGKKPTKVFPSQFVVSSPSEVSDSAAWSYSKVVGMIGAPQL